MAKLRGFLVFVFVALSSVVAGAAGGAVKSLGDVADNPSVQTPQVETSARAVPVKKEWTILIFNNANNNLERLQLDAMNTLEFFGSRKDVNVVVQLGRPGTSGTDGNWKGARRYLIAADNDRNNINSPVLWQAEKCDMGDYKNVIDFAGWAAYNFPAKRYMLVIANHGYGWIDPSFGEKKTSRGISFDDLSGNYIRTAQMGPMLYGVDKAIGKKLDIFYSAACLMQMVEVAYEIRNYADVLVASEASAYTSSVGEILWPNVVKAILDSPTLSTDNLAKAVVDYYAYGLKTKNLSGTLSAVRGMYIENLAKEMSAWATLAMEVNDQPAAKAAKMQAIRYDVDSYADLGDFLKIYTENMKATGPKADALRKLTAQALDHLQKFVVVRNAALGECQRSAGIAISLPARYSDALSWLPAFNALGFGKASEWGKFCVYLNQIK